ncbi:splicing factor 3A subunit 1 [Acrasis kona]
MKEEDGDDMEVETVSQPVTQQVITKKADVAFKPGRDKPASDPIPYKYDVQVPATISPLELDTIKLMALYTAKNGKQFLYTISNRESRNPQFDFLKLNHKHFSFFSKLTEVYANILAIPKPSVTQDVQDVENLRFIANRSDKSALLDRLFAKAEWETSEMQRKRKEDMEQKEEREAFNQIDWNDFVVVETIDFDEFQTVAPVYDPYDQVDYYDDVAPYEPSQPKTVEEQNIIDQMESKVVNDYQPTQKKKQSGPQTNVQYFKNPATGELIPSDKVADHMRIVTLDPRWKEQKERASKKFTNTNIASDAEITDQLTNFAKHRGDIFGRDDAGKNIPAPVNNNDPSQQQMMQQQAAMMAAQMMQQQMNARPPVQDEKDPKKPRTNGPAPQNN